MKPFFEYFQKLSNTKQYLVVKLFYDWGIYVFDAFYMTYVFKESNDVRQVLYNILLTLLTVFVSFVLGSLVMKKIGVELNFKLSFILYIITGLVGIYLVNIGLTSFIIISCVRGLAEGFFWVSANMVELNGLPSDSRSRYLSISHGLNQMFYVIAPVTLGFLLTRFNSLLPTYILFTLICALAIVFPYKFNMNDRISVEKSKIKAIISNKDFGKFGVIKGVLAIGWMLDWMLSSIIPFVILGNEFNMGIFLTISSLVGVLIAFVTNKVKIAKKIKWGFPLLLIGLLAEMLLVFRFDPYILYIESIVFAITGAVVIPLEFDLSNRITNAIDPAGVAGLELNMMQETIYTVARILIGMLVVAIFSLHLPLIALLQTMIVLYVISKLANYLLSVKFLKIS